MYICSAFSHLWKKILYCARDVRLSVRQSVCPSVRDFTFSSTRKCALSLTAVSTEYYWVLWVLSIIFCALFNFRAEYADAWLSVAILKILSRGMKIFKQDIIIVRNQNQVHSSSIQLKLLLWNSECILFYGYQQSY
jgi:hypothetical protein